MPSRKRHLYPKRKISRKIKGGNTARHVGKIGSSLVFSMYGVPAILAAAGFAAPGMVTVVLSQMILGPMFLQIYGFLEDNVLSEENITKVAKIIYSILPASIFSYLILSLNADFKTRGLVAIPDILKQSLFGWSQNVAAKDFGSTAANVPYKDFMTSKHVSQSLNPDYYKSIGLSLETSSLPLHNPIIQAEITGVPAPIGPSFPMSLPSDNPALMIQKTGVTATNAPNPINVAEGSTLYINPNGISHNSVKLQSIPEVMQGKFGEFVELLKKLLISSTPSSTGLTTTGNVIAAAAIGFAIYYIKTRLTASREENEKLNKQLSEHERRRLLIYRYQQRMKQYEETEKETDELEQKEEEEIKSEKHFSDLVSEKREMKEEKRRMKEEEEEQIVLKKPKTPTKKPRTPKKRPPTPAKNYRPEFGENAADQYKLRPSTPK